MLINHLFILPILNHTLQYDLNHPLIYSLVLSHGILYFYFSETQLLKLPPSNKTLHILPKNNLLIILNILVKVTLIRYMKWNILLAAIIQNKAYKIRSLKSIMQSIYIMARFGFIKYFQLSYSLLNLVKFLKCRFIQNF